MASEKTSPAASAPSASASDDRRFRLLVEAIEDYAIYMLDCLGHVITWNRGAELNKGYTRAEILGRSYQTFFVPEDIAAGVPGQRLAEAARVGRCAGEGWRLRKNGERFWASYVLTAMHDDSGNLVGFAKVTRDLSEHKRQEDAMLAMEHALREERDRLQGAAESSMDSLYICEAVRDSDGEIEDFIFTYLNSNVERMVSIPRSAMLGARMCELMPHNIEMGLFERYKRVVLTGEPLVHEFPINVSDVKSVWIRIQVVKVKDGIAITASDIGDRKRAENLIYQDPLTGLPNRRLLNDRIGQGIERAKRYSHRLGVFLIDLDGFKHINDTLGHSAGDKVLITVADRLRAAVRGTDTVIRIGGDEFVVVMPDIARESDIKLCARKILATIRSPIAFGDQFVSPTCTIGIAIYPDSGESGESLLANADAAMYDAKRCGKNRLAVCLPTESEGAMAALPHS